MSVVGSNVLAGASGQVSDAALQIDRSLRFNSADSAYLSRTPSSAGNRRRWTWSGWIKRGKISANYFAIFGAGGGSVRDRIQIFNNHKFVVNFNDGNDGQLTTTQVLRDPSAWMHIVVALDTTQPTASDRTKIYINGSQVTNFDTANYVAQNYETKINNNIEQFIGNSSSNDLYFDGYMANVEFIDGQALAPTDFGETDSDNNWNPKAYSGTYGTNGFHLDFADPADLGDDNSGNGNDWTPNNLVGSAGAATADQGFDVVTYTGNGGSQSITGLSFQPDFVWIKNRSSFTNQTHALFDVIRGKQMLASNSTNSEANWHGSNGLPYRGYVDSFDSNGFSLAANSASNLADYVNFNNTTYVAWCWKAGGAASSNTDGTLTSSVSANTTYGFSVGTYTGSYSSQPTSLDTVGHGLGAAPALIISKSTSGTSSWHVWHSALANNEYLRLNSTNAKATLSIGAGGTIATAPTSTVFPTYFIGGSNNGSSDNLVFYCWSEVSGFSKFGSWTGNGSTTGPVVTTGFKPRFLLWKRADSAANWAIVDSARSTSNPRDEWLGPNSSSAESANNAAYAIDFLDDGFQIKATHEATNVNGGTYIYAAYADKPDSSGIDSLIDTPTNYDADSGNNGGNYCTMNPLPPFPVSDRLVLSNGNLDAEATGTNSSGNWKCAVSTFAFNSGKWYAEFTVAAFGGANYINIGINPLNKQSTPLQSFSDSGHYYNITGNLWNATSYGGSYGAAVVGDIIGVAVDMDTNNDIKFYKNGSLLATVSLNSNITTHGFQFALADYTTSKVNCNFGQRPFAHPVSGYKSACTQNLADPTIADGSTAMDVALWTANGSNQTITGFNFSPDLVWAKSRSTGTTPHLLVDTVRGASQSLSSHSTGAEEDYSGISGVISSFNSDGFDTGGNSDIATNNRTFVGWSWDAGTSTVSNTDGTITSNVRANPSAGFSICTYTGSTGNQSFGHGLNAAPKFIVIKNRSTAANWFAMVDIGTTYLKYGHLNATDAFGDATAQSVSSSTVTLGNNNAWFGANGDNYVAYCFAPVAGYSAFGTYTGNGSADGPFVFTGMRPKWIMTKVSAGDTGHWWIYDSERNTYNLADSILNANLSNAEYTSNGMDILSNGFKIRSSNANTNGSGFTFFYAAFAEHPQKTARAR